MNRLLLVIFLSITVGGLSSQTLRGYVKERHKQELSPIPGANVLWKGTTKGSVTDARGYFEINMPAGEELSLLISFIGYETQELIIGKEQKKILVILKEISTSLDDIAVMGKKDAVSFNIKSIENKINISKEGIKRLAC